MLRKLETIFFFHQFRKCIKNENLNFLKVTENEYLVFRVFQNKVADLTHERYSKNESPCDSTPIWDESIKLNFSPSDDNHIIQETIEKILKN